MSEIFSRLAAMMPWMLLVLPAALLWRFFAVRRLRERGDRTTRLHEAGVLILVLFVVGLLSQAVLPQFQWGPEGLHLVQTGEASRNLIPFRVFFDAWRELGQGNTQPLLVSVLGNIGMFVPVGLLAPLLWRWPSSLGAALGAGFSLSLFIEAVQLFLPRAADVDDLILNTLGALLGWGIYRLGTWFFPFLEDEFKVW